MRHSSRYICRYLNLTYYSDYIVQGRRFVILEDIGCIPHTYITWVSLIIVYCPPLVIGLISAVYAIHNIIQFRKLWNEINNFPGYNNLTTSRFLRFMYLSSVDIIFTVPLATYSLYAAIISLNPWVSWANAHSNFSIVPLVPATVWRTDPETLHAQEMARWIVVFCAFVYFGFFGLTAQSRKNYYLGIQIIAQGANIFTSRVAKRENLTPLAFQSAPHPNNKPHRSTEVSTSIQDNRLDENHEMYLKKYSVPAPICGENLCRSMGLNGTHIAQSSSTNSAALSASSADALNMPARTQINSMA